MAKYQNESSLEELAEVAGALSEPKRLLALGMLSGGELCLCDLTKGLGIASSTVSNHMAILKRAGLVESRKDGRWMYFRLASEATPTAATALRWAMEYLPTASKSVPKCKSGECP